MGKEANGEPKGFASSVFLVTAVAVVMVVGMYLRTDTPNRPSAPAAVPEPAASLALGSTVTPELPAPEPIEPPPSPTPVPVPVPARAPAPADVDPLPGEPIADPLVARLAARAEDDSARLAKARGRWTAQLLVACKPETVDRLLANAGGTGGLFVLPAQVKEEPCFRVCFGTYASAQEAAAASGLPKALRGKDKIAAVEVAKVLP